MAGKELAVQGKLLDISLKEGITPEEAMACVDSVCAHLRDREMSVQYARFMTAKILRDVNARNLFAPAFGSFEQYTIALAKKHRVSRSTLRRYMMIVERLEKYVSPKEVDKIPGSSLTLLARAAPKTDARELRKLVSEALQKDATEFGEGVMSRGLVGRPGRPDSEHASKTVNLRIQMSRALASRWKILVGDRTPGAVFGELVNEALAAVQQKKAA